MRILLVHNFYRAATPSGENVVYAAERELLRRAGHEVVEFNRSNDEVAQAPVRVALESALFTPWNPFSARRFQRTLAESRPDVVHVHNTFPLISPSILSAAHHGGAAVTMTLHNYRLFCSAAIAMRQGQPCLLCLEQRSVMPAMRYACYRGSRLATAPVAGMIALHRRLDTWSRHVDAFICLSEFQRERLQQAGLPRERMHLKANFSQPPAARANWSGREDKAVFIGRLGEEKGVDVLVRAWLEWGRDAPALEIMGSGDQEPLLRRLLADSAGADRVRLLGQLPHDEVLRRLASAKLLLLPSRCIEGMPLTVLEGFAHGVPAAVSRLGPLPELVSEGESGCLFEPGDPDALLSAVRAAWGRPEALERMSRAAADRFDRLYSPDATYAQLMRVYEAAIATRRACA